jgi:predicted nucleic acid-binding protein
MSVLVDTGILLRAFDTADPYCESIRATVRQLRRQNEELMVTFQNVAEFVNVSTRPLSARGGYGQTLSMVQARVNFIERLYRRLSEDDHSYQQWKQLISKYSVSGVAVHDARLVAIMLSHDVKQVLTLNDRDFRRYEPEGISIITPQLQRGE